MDEVLLIVGKCGRVLACGDGGGVAFGSLCLAWRWCLAEGVHVRAVWRRTGRFKWPRRRKRGDA